MPSRHGSIFDSPPSQTRLAYALVPHSSSSMHDPHPQDAFDFDSQRFHVDQFGPIPVSSPSHQQDYGTQSPTMSVTHSIGGHHVGAARPKRKQVKNACSACQRACKRCDVGRPCERCLKYGMGDSCRDSLRKERKKGIKRGPYKKRDGESALPAPHSVADVASPGMLNELQRSMPKSRMSRVSSISEPSHASTSASVSQMEHSTPAAVPLFIQPVPSARPSEGPFPYSTSVMIPAPAQHSSLASMQSSSSHASIHHHSSKAENQYYQPRYDHLSQAPARPEHFRMDSYAQEYPSKPVVDHRPMRTLQYPSPDHSPPRERQYSMQGYDENRHGMVQASHDVSYHPNQGHESSRPVDVHYAYTNQRSYQEQPYSERHMSDTQELQPQQQQYYPYNYQHSNYGSYYSQNHASHTMAPQHIPEQTDSGYLNRAAPDQVGYGSSINPYPTQPSYPSHQPGSVNYAMRAAGRGMSRDTVVHPHVSNVQVQSS